MAYRTISSLLPILVAVVIIILAVAGREAVAARNVREKSSIGDKKQPQWLVGYDGVSVLIPGIGRITLPPYDKGSSGDHAASSGQYIPGADDNFIPNPGFEVPNPANIGGVKATPPSLSSSSNNHQNKSAMFISHSLVLPCITSSLILLNYEYKSLVEIKLQSLL